MVESLFTELNGRRIHYLKAGRGPAVILVHGGASASQEWVGIMEEFADRFTFFAPDLPGFGQSDRDANGYYLNDYPDFMQGFILQQNISNPVLVGHSFGGRVCLDTAQIMPGAIAKLILIDSSGLGKISPHGRVLFDFFTVLRKALKKPQPYPVFLSHDGDDWDYVGDAALKALKIPTLLIWKQLDPYMPLSHARRALKLMLAVRLAVVKGYGHAPHQQKDNHEFKRLFLEFLDSSGGK